MKWSTDVDGCGVYTLRLCSDVSCADSSLVPDNANVHLASNPLTGDSTSFADGQITIDMAQTYDTLYYLQGSTYQNIVTNMAWLRMRVCGGETIIKAPSATRDFTTCLGAPPIGLDVASYVEIKY